MCLEMTIDNGETISSDLREKAERLKSVICYCHYGTNKKCSSQKRFINLKYRLGKIAQALQEIRSERLVSITQLAKIKGHSPQAIRKAIKTGRIKAFKIGKQWVVRVNEKDKTRQKQSLYLCPRSRNLLKSFLFIISPPAVWQTLDQLHLVITV